ncbi:MAG: hypothetical protein JRC77_01540 [Deltaproteobacteria bacterium]|nr:hypothetical protein [Deltaproteobacteria bacterium]
MDESRPEQARFLRSHLLDPLVYSSIWMASAAACLTFAAGKAMGLPFPTHAGTLTFCGILLVYNLDRLRDLDRDRATSPRRSAFIEHYRKQLWGLTVASAVGASLLLLQAPRAVQLIAVGVLLLGFAHRRIKRLAYFKELYLTAAWLAGILGLPANYTTSTTSATGAQHLAYCACVLGPALLANDMAASIRDAEGITKKIGCGVTLQLSRAIALIAVGFGIFAPESVQPLTAVPALTALALLGYRPGETYGFLAVDGALFAGALMALALS